MKQVVQDRLADAFLESALEERIQGASPPDLSSRILARAAGQPAPPQRVPVAEIAPRSPNPRVLPAAVVVAGLGVVALIAALVDSGRIDLALQDPEQGNPMGGAAFLPLRPGTVWEYSVEEGGETRKATAHVHTSANVGGRRVHQILTLDGDDLVFSYYAADDEGVYRYPGRVFGSWPGLAPDAEPARVLAAPVGLETEWRWRIGEPRRLPRGVSANIEARIVERQAELVGVSEEVTVPAGTFEAVHVAIRAEDDGGETWTEHTWYARGVGVVEKTVEIDGEVVRRQRLVRHVRGASSPGREAVLQEYFARSGLGEPDRVEWLDLSGARWVVRSDFAVVHSGEERLVLRLLGEEVTPFDPTSVGDFDELVQAEGLSELNQGLYPQAMTVALNEIAARATGAKRGYSRIHGPSKKKSEIGAADRYRNVEASYAAENGAGGKVPMRVKVTLKHGRVVQVSVN